MKKRFLKLTAAALLLLLLPVWLLLSGAALPSYYGESYYAVLPRMFERLTAAEGRKLVIVGGSNVAFGLDGALLEELLASRGYSYTVCPFGLYGAVGTGAMLDLSLDALGEGDIVILAVEPTSDTMSSYFGAGALWKCAEDAPELLLKLSSEHQAAMLGTYIPYLQERYAIERSGILPVAEGVYAASAFDDRCDMIYDRPGNILAVGYDTGTPVDLAGVEIAPAFAEAVHAYCAEAEEKGAAVVMSFSPVNASALTDGSEEAVGAFFRLCNETLDCAVISDPNDYILDSGWFYDSNFHLNSSGAQLRTCLLAQDILAYLGCYEPLAYQAPEMPASAAQLSDNGAEEAYFTFAPMEDGVGYLISGLTEEGLTRKTLTVPSAYNGAVVAGFTSDALAGAEMEELRLPPSIESLPDGLFRECAKLTRLILEHTDSPCRITDGTFADAAQVRIYVPAQAYPMYRDGYGCEANPWTAYLDRIFTY